MTETRANEYNAYYTVVGDFDPSSLTQVAGLQPTRAWKKGDLNEKTDLPRKHSRWCLDSRLDMAVEIEKHVEDVLEQVRPHASVLREFSEAHGGGGIEIVGYFFESYPGLFLGKKIIADAAALGVSIDFDFYYLYSDRREDS